jgi:hypothetical protein
LEEQLLEEGKSSSNIAPMHILTPTTIPTKNEVDSFDLDLLGGLVDEFVQDDSEHSAVGSSQSLGNKEPSKKQQDVFEASRIQVESREASADSFDPEAIHTFSGLLYAPAVDFNSAPIVPEFRIDTKQQRRREGKRLFRFLLAVAWLRQGQGCNLRAATHAQRSALITELGAAENGICGSVFLLCGSGFRKGAKERALSAKIKQRLQTEMKAGEIGGNSDSSSDSEPGPSYFGDAALNLWPHSAICFGEQMVSELPMKCEVDALIQFPLESSIISRSSSRLQLRSLRTTLHKISKTSSFNQQTRQIRRILNERGANLPSDMLAQDSSGSLHVNESTGLIVLRLGDILSIRVDRRIKGNPQLGCAPIVYNFTSLRVRHLARPIVLQWSQMKDAHMFANSVKLLVACMQGGTETFTEVGGPSSCIQSRIEPHTVQEIVDVHFASAHNRKVAAAESHSSSTKRSPISQLSKTFARINDADGVDNTPRQRSAGGQHPQAPLSTDSSSTLDVVENTGDKSGPHTVFDDEASLSTDTSGTNLSRTIQLGPLLPQLLSSQVMTAAPASLWPIDAYRSDGSKSGSCIRQDAPPEEVLSVASTQLSLIPTSNKSQHSSALDESARVIENPQAPPARHAISKPTHNVSNSALQTPCLNLQECLPLSCTHPPVQIASLGSASSPLSDRRHSPNSVDQTKDDFTVVQPRANDSALRNPLVANNNVHQSMEVESSVGGNASRSRGSDSAYEEVASESQSIVATSASVSTTGSILTASVLVSSGSEGESHKRHPDAGDLVQINRPFLVPIAKNSVFSRKSKSIVHVSTIEGQSSDRDSNVGGGLREAATQSLIQSSRLHAEYNAIQGEPVSVRARVQRARAVKSALEQDRLSLVQGGVAKQRWKNMQASARRAVLHRRRTDDTQPFSSPPGHGPENRILGDRQHTRPSTSGPMSYLGQVESTFGTPQPLPGRKRSYTRDATGELRSVRRPVKLPDKQLKVTKMQPAPQLSEQRSQLATPKVLMHPPRLGGSQVVHGKTTQLLQPPNVSVLLAVENASLASYSMVYSESASVASRVDWWQLLSLRKQSKLITGMPY